MNRARARRRARTAQLARGCNAKVVTNACSLRDIDQIRRPDREAVRGE